MPEYTYFKYYQNVSDDSKKAVKNAVLNFKQKIKTNKDFMKGFTFYVVNSYKDLEKKSALTKYVQENSDEFFATGGMTVSSNINEGKKEIILSVQKNGIESIWNDNKSRSDISQALLHEIGHQFDDYFGSCDSKLREKIRTMHFEINSKEDEKIFSRYLKTKDLSDTKDFKAAWKKDVSEFGGRSLWQKLFNTFPFEYTPYEIDITDGVTDEEVEQSDNTRSEIFAQLFSYALGEDDGNKKVITEKYKNTYKLVKEYIGKFLGIECK